MYADVIFPLALPKAYTYALPARMREKVRPGMRVAVQFGRKKIYSALVTAVHSREPQGYKVKEVMHLLDEAPVVNEKQLAFWQWLAAYYMCSAGEVMHAALPAGFRLSSETRISANPQWQSDKQTLDEKEKRVFGMLQNHKALSLEKLASAVGRKSVLPMVKFLLEKKAVELSEYLQERYKPKAVTWIRLTPEFTGEEKLKEILTHLEKKAPRQMELLLTFLSLRKDFPIQNSLLKSELLQRAGASGAAFSALVHRGIFETFRQEVSRLEVPAPAGESTGAHLTAAQQRALGELKEALKNRGAALLHGVTSSGKTELYIRLIRETLDEGKQVLYLLPEIALTTQIVSRLRRHFGGRTGVYHSRFSDAERVEIWNTLLPGAATRGDKGGPGGSHPGYDLILGARSALFLPFSNLGLIIIDEEHEYSYKQVSPAPRYHARDAALYLARLHGALTLLGSATPSLESYTNAVNGKYGLVELPERYGDMQLPAVHVVNIAEESRKKRMKAHLSPFLMEMMGEALGKSEQVILFRNRRGYAPFLLCTTCASVPHCRYCDITLTYHLREERLRCHYCGYSIAVPEVCPACGMPTLITQGFGTEKMEEELQRLFPSARIARMDLDTTRTKDAFSRIIGDFEARKIDVLAGTQMVSKGLDFDNVSIVGVLHADQMLHWPDFRAHERSFQMLAQVSGRAGRKHRQGQVIIQTCRPKHPVIADVVNNDYHSMYNKEMEQRKKYGYPPFSRLIEITASHRDRAPLDRCCAQLGEVLKKEFGKRLLGPEYPPVSRLRNEFIKKCLIKIEKEASQSRAKEIIAKAIADLSASREFRKVRMVVDVDPVG